MFEQSILAKENPATKTRALAASFGLQALILAIGLLIPLIFGDHMPSIQLLTKLSVPVLSRPEPAPAPPPGITTSAPSALRAPTRVFELQPVSSHVAAAAPIVMGDLGPASDGPHVPGAPVGIDNFLPPIKAIAVVAPPPKPAPIVSTAPAKPVVVGGEVLAAKLIRKIVPAYPPLAVKARVDGVVRLQGIVNKQGAVEQLQVLSGNPLLIPAAVAAVRQWLYTPTYLNGQPVEVTAPIDVIFKLAQ